MLKFVAVRHGDANEIGLFHEKKNLSALGIKQVEATANLLKGNDLFPNVIYTSPKLRAVETANILKEILVGNIFEENALCEPFDSKKLLNILADTANDKSIVFFVGHAPTLAEFVNDLVGKNVLEHGLPKGSAALVTFESTVEYGKGTFQKFFQK